MKKRVALWQRSTWRLPKIRQFVLKRRRALALTGAIVVFMTAIVKENFRDEFRDAANSLTAAEGVYQSEAETATTTIQIYRLQTNAVMILETLLHREKASAAHIIAIQRMNYDEVRVKSEAMLTQRMVNLAKELPLLLSITILPRLVTHLSGLVKVQKSLATLQASEIDDPSGFEEPEAEISSLEQEEVALGSDLVTREESVRDFYEHAYERSDRISYVLYLLGTAIGLVAIWFGVADTKADSQA